jgi:hypothetical protein
MKPKLLWLPLAWIAASNVYGMPIVTFHSFDEVIIYVTDTFETAGGTPLFATNGVAYSDSLSPMIASQMSADSTLPIQVRSTAGLIPEVSEYQFVTAQGLTYVLLNGTAPAIVDPSGDYDSDAGNALVAAGGAAFASIGSPIYITSGRQSYTTFGLSDDGSTEVIGAATFDIFEETIIERALVTPEPGPCASIAIGLLILIHVVRRGTSQ